MLDFNKAERIGNVTPINNVAAFCDAMREHGLMPDKAIADGQIHRFTVQGDKARSDNGWYVLHDDGDFAAGSFGTWKENGTTHKWCSKRDNEMTDVERAEYRRRMAEAADARRALREQEAKECREASAAIWEKAKPATEHPYLTAKGVKSHGLRVSRDKLLVPIMDKDGVIHGVQFISCDSDKKYKKGAVIRGNFYMIPGTGPLVLCEGYATGASIHEATGYPVAVAFDCGNLVDVAKVVRPAIVAADDDRNTKGNPGLAHGKKAADEVGAIMVYPSGIQGTDFNDLQAEKGIKAVKDCFMREPSTRFKLLKRDDIKSLPPLEWVVKGILPSKGMAQIFGPSRAGKSFLSFDMGCAIAEGREWFGYRVRQRPVIYIMLEGEGGLKQRMEAWEEHNSRRLPEEFMAVTQNWGITIDQDIDDLAAIIPKGAVMFVDTQNRAAPMVNENSSEDMGAIIEGSKRLERITGGVVVLVAHTGKDTTKGVRGHSSQIAAVDASIEVIRVGEQRTWRADKVKDGLDGKEHPFKLKVIELGKDEDDDPITSCVIDTTDCDAVVNMTAMEKVAIDALLKASATCSIQADGMWGATQEDWKIEFVNNRDKAKGGKEVTKGAIDKSFTRAKDDLISKNIVSPVGNVMIPHGGSYQEDIITMMSMSFAFKR